jgi:outer membrane biosynthesis protein TonB
MRRVQILSTSRRDDPTHVGRAPFVRSAVVHLVAIILAWWAQTSHAAPVDFQAIEVMLISPPPATAAEVTEPAREEELVVETPDPQPPEPEPEPEEEPPPPVVEDEPEPEEVVEEVVEEDPEPEPPPADDPPAEVTTPDPDLPEEEATTDEPADVAEESGDDLNVRIEGLRRDYPAYYNNIIRQMRRCFRWRGQGNPTTVMRFVVERDGTVPDRSIEIVQPSGNVEFDFEMMGTVECASGRLGALPEDFPYDQLPVQFSFSPDAVREDPDAEKEPDA